MYTRKYWLDMASYAKSEEERSYYIRLANTTQE